MAIGIVTIATGALVSGLISLVAFSPGVGDFVSQTSYNIMRNRLLTLAELLRAYYQGEISESTFKEQLHKGGYSDELIKVVTESYPDRLNVSEIIRLWFRYKDNPTSDFPINKQWLTKRLKEAGIHESVHKELIESERPVPTLQDIITFAVRDVFEPEQVRQAGLLQGIPFTYLQEAKKRGLSEQDARYYWAAHWNLPGLHQVYEILHRFHPDIGEDVQFSERDMDIFFNLADIAPGYRELLKRISYNPIGRVDIRRFWRIGLYKEYDDPKQELVKDYRRLGYSPRDAKRMADFTIRYESPGRKTFTRAQIKRFYVNNLFGKNNRERALEELQATGYDKQDATLILDLWDKEFISAEEQDRIETIQERWINKEIPTEAGLRTELSKVGLTQEQINKTIQSFERETIKRRAKLTFSQIEDLYSNGIIGIDEFTELLKIKGYSQRDVNLLLQLYRKGRTASTRVPQTTDILKWYNDELIGQLKFLEYMRLAGYRDEFILLYADSAGRPFDDEFIEENLGITRKGLQE